MLTGNVTVKAKIFGRMSHGMLFAETTPRGVRMFWRGGGEAARRVAGLGTSRSTTSGRGRRVARRTS